MTGAGGLLGGCDHPEFEAAGATVVPARPRRARRDPSRARSKRRWRAAPDVVVNCAAYNDVDGAEDDPVAALAVNALAVRALARGATGGRRPRALRHRFRVRRRADRPYVEDDPTRTREASMRASKLLGEWFALEHPRAYVLRVESLFGEPGRAAAGAAASGDPRRGSQPGGRRRCSSIAR